MTAAELIAALQAYIDYAPAESAWKRVVEQDGDVFLLHPMVVPDGIDWSEGVPE